MPPETPPPLRFFELLRTLRAHEVEFVLIGGFALAFHGAPRATKDVDIVPKPGRENLTRLWRALEELEARPQGIEDFRPEEMPMEWGLDGLIEGGGNWIVHTRLGRLDVMQWVDPFDSYDELRENAVEEYVDEIGSTILVTGLDDLIAMKEVAGRDQDRIDVTALRMAHGLEE
ncbi:MAG TPA: nucleotidyl transferase AbiEii/AbiGii toxin family protein [Gaiellaceae bacterium]|nr:nucleotidyl transferase AbiEii/AbiGii toxin family protein [Gaiellaceae bacterium]